MRKKYNELIENRKKIKFILESVKYVSYENDEISDDFKMRLGDYLTDDIATEWGLQQVKLAEELLKSNRIKEREYELLKAIDHNFEEASLNGIKYQEEIWTLEGHKNHPFWKKQRELAKELVVLLEKDLLEIEKQKD